MKNLLGRILKWPLRSGPFHEERGVHVADFFFGSTVGVVVRSNRFAGPLRRAIEWRRMDVIRGAGGAEDSAAIEERKDLLIRVRHLLVP